jgi:hypothetical protein
MDLKNENLKSILVLLAEVFDQSQQLFDLTWELMNLAGLNPNLNQFNLAVTELNY